jgi:hypothetical protein
MAVSVRVTLIVRPPALPFYVGAVGLLLVIAALIGITG